MKKNKFSEISAICFLIKELQKRAVYGLDSLKKGDIVYANKEIRITSSPGRNKYCNSLFVQCDININNSFFKNSSISLSDHNVINGGYNLFRLFRNKCDADLYYSLIYSILNNLDYKEFIPDLISSGPYFDPELYKTFPISII